jgi:hypothetical protein
VRVGVVRSVRLAADGSHVRAALDIEARYRPLVRPGAVFRPAELTAFEGSWNKGFRSRLGIDALAGGVDREPAAAQGKPVPSGHEFELRGG